MDFLNMSDQTDKQTEPYRFFGTQEGGDRRKTLHLSYDDAPGSALLRFWFWWPYRCAARS